jgi:hypothetical protein
MKTSLLIVIALAVLVALVAIPAGPRSERTASFMAPQASGLACRLQVEVGPHTVVDRGTLEALESGTLDVGAFRYWEESTGPVLYVYDDVQNLQGRIRNPRSVRVLTRD